MKQMFSMLALGVMMTASAQEGLYIHHQKKETDDKVLQALIATPKLADEVIHKGQETLKQAHKVKTMIDLSQTDEAFRACLVLGGSIRYQQDLLRQAEKHKAASSPEAYATFQTRTQREIATLTERLDARCQAYKELL